jgi:hypothetical protein
MNASLILVDSKPVQYTEETAKGGTLSDSPFVMPKAALFQKAD